MPLQPRPIDPRHAVRLGLRSSPFTDLYYRVMESSWLMLFGVLACGYLLINVVFAAIYCTDSAGIRGAEDGSFLDAFAFSVQTLSTIGYGTFSPQTGATHTWVTIESMVGFISTAIATGLVFSKFARPKANVLFSQTIVVQPRNGQPSLAFRLGNARANEIIEASIRVSVLLPEVTTEGDHMRRFVDLQLIRSTSPMFAMTWTIVHEITEASPLHGRDADSFKADGLRFIVSFTGIDATFSQTVHARYIYDHHDVQWGRRFVDIVDMTDDGRLRINYQHFHKTKALHA